MRRGGELRPHMHEHGRLIGAVYINVPDKNETDKGNFVVRVDEDLCEENRGYISN
ncbi:MAG: hypothetical protein VXX78_05605 [Pseudomonadota bacterium]|nr:hypothetical protein [Pseudomonadota bacterium]